MAWLSGFSYRKKIPVAQRSAGSLSNYPLKLTIYSGTGSDSQGVLYLNNHCANFPNDIRFTQSDGTTTLDYWIEKDGASNPKTIWVKIPNVSDTSQTDYYIYYGNESATDNSCGNDVFPLFDDFSGSALKNIWGSGGKVVLNNNTVVVSGTSLGHAWISANSYSYNYSIRSRAQATSVNSYDLVSVGFGCGDYWKNYADGAVHLRGYDPNAEPYFKLQVRNSCSTGIDSNTSQDENWHIFELIRSGSTTGMLIIDDSDETKTTECIPTNALPPLVFASKVDSPGTTIVTDWIFVRPYNPPQPTWATPGAEEILESYNFDTLASLTTDIDFKVDAIFSKIKSVETKLNSITSKEEKIEYLLNIYLRSLTSALYSFNTDLSKDKVCKEYFLDSFLSSMITAEYLLDLIMTITFTKSQNFDVSFNKRNLRTKLINSILSKSKEQNYLFSTLTNQANILKHTLNSILTRIYPENYNISTIIKKSCRLLLKLRTNLRGSIAAQLLTDTYIEYGNRRHLGFDISLFKRPCGNLKIYYSSLSDPHYFSVWCTRWDTIDYKVIVEGILLKSDVDLLLNNTKPGAVKALYKLLGRPYYYDTTFTGKNTIKLVPIAGSSLSNIRNEKTIYVQNLTIGYLEGRKDYSYVKIEGYISGENV